MTESAIGFDCHSDALVGILHRPPRPRRRGIVVVVGGGPQYRAGGHRQLTLWARTLCDEGYPVFRFDYRGMGDSQGEFRGFLDVDDDIRCAIDRFCAELPEVDEIVLWGECDAASAILLYAYRDRRVRGAVLLNPWVRTEAGAARAVLRFYYLQRLLQPSLWKKIFSGRFNPLASARSALALLRQARAQRSVPAPTAAGGSLDAPISRSLPLTESMLMGLRRFEGNLMLVLSGRDLIAREFDVLIDGSSGWKRALTQKRIARHDLAEGDHTFSSAVLRGQVITWGLEWLRQW
jgi:exosortase A-associated hydrolase 1